MNRALHPAMVLVFVFACAGFEPEQPWTGWSARCPITIAPPAEAPPVEWADCGPGCERLTTTRGRLVGRPRAADDAFVVTHILPGVAKSFLVVNERGAIRHAIRQDWETVERCVYRVDAADGTRLVLGARGAGGGPWREAAGDGAVVYDLERRTLSVAHRDVTPDIGTYALAAGRLLRTTSKTRRLEVVDGKTLHDPTVDARRLLASGRVPVASSDATYFEVGRGRDRAVKRWRAGEGSVELFRAAGNLGGHDGTLVWTADLDGDPWIMTARVGDGVERARRVALDPNPSIGAAPFVVGEGRAAHWAPGGVAIVDLSSGAMDRIDIEIENWRLGAPIAIASHRLLVTAHKGVETTVLRLCSTPPGAS